MQRGGGTERKQERDLRERGGEGERGGGRERGREREGEEQMGVGGGGIETDTEKAFVHAEEREYTLFIPQQYRY